MPNSKTYKIKDGIDIFSLDNEIKDFYNTFNEMPKKMTINYDEYTRINDELNEESGEDGDLVSFSQTFKQEDGSEQSIKLGLDYDRDLEWDEVVLGN